ncbi:hypothetical protein D3C72_1085780 [compost metagenome]
METVTAQAMVSARSANSCPSTSLSKSTGRKMATVVRVEATRAVHTRLVPSSAASALFRSPRSWRR